MRPAAFEREGQRPSTGRGLVKESVEWVKRSCLGGVRASKRALTGAPPGHSPGAYYESD